MLPQLVERTQLSDLILEEEITRAQRDRCLVECAMEMNRKPGTMSKGPEEEGERENERKALAVQLPQNKAAGVGDHPPGSW